MMTGVIMPCCAWVAALNALQNSMMLTPRWPSAGPTGGLGFACPAGICSLISPMTFLAILVALHLNEIELDRSRAPKDADQHPELSFVRPDFFHNTVEIDERAVDHLHALADGEEHARLRLDRAFLHLLRDRPDFFLTDRRRIRRAADEAGNLRRFLDDVPGIVVQLHLNEDVAGKKFSRRGLLFPLHELHDFFDRHEDLAELVGLPHAPDALFQRRLHFLLVAGESVDDVPLLGHRRHSRS